MAALITFLAFLCDWILGDPQRWPHPVRLVGGLIAFGERKFRLLAGDDPKYLEYVGSLLASTVILITMGAVALILHLAAWIGGLVWFLVTLYLVYSALCLRDLYNQTWQVEKALAGGFVNDARQRLSWVVGRDTENLEPPAIRRAVIETLAENFSDGLVAPLFYLALGGPVLAWGCKAVNTLDSMIGYKNERYLHLGRFAAQFDDLVNYVPARLSALLLVWAARLLGYDWRAAHRVWRRDGHLHASPNSGQPEAAMAGALGLWLGGASTYGGVLSDKPVINPEGGESGTEAVRAAEKMVVGASILMLLIVLLVLIIFSGVWGWG